MQGIKQLSFPEPIRTLRRHGRWFAAPGQYPCPTFGWRHVTSAPVPSTLRWRSSQSPSDGQACHSKPSKQCRSQSV